MEQIALDSLDARYIFFHVYGDAQYWKQGEGWSFVGNPRKDSGFMLILCKKINILLKNGLRKVFHKGDLIFIPKHSEYSIQFWDTAEGQYSDILINYQIYDLDGRDYCLFSEISLMMENTPPEIEEIFRSVSRFSLNLRNPYFQINEQFFRLFHLLQSCHLANTVDMKTRKTISIAVAYMETHIVDNPSISELAQMCMLSETGFRVAFKREIGISPAEYKISLKIEKAKTMLLNLKENSISDISSMLGFCDSAYFNRIFKKLVRISPGKYRQMHNEPDKQKP